MRVSTIIAITVVAGLALFVWWGVATIGAVAQISGGSYGPQPVNDFAIENFLGLALTVVLVGLLIAAIVHESKKSMPSEDNASQDTDFPPPTV